MEKFSERIYNIFINKSDQNCTDQPDGSSITDSDDELPFECCFCADLFFDESRFKKHDCQKQNISNKCDFKDCNKIFKKASELRKHQRIHFNIRNFKCTKCSKDFVHQTSLKNHLLTHSKAKNFICNYCGFAASTSGNLQQHKAKHEDESSRRFTCDVCDKKFSRSSNLKEHLVTHTKEKSHLCMNCGKKFSSSSSLAKHQKLHKGLKEFSCPVTSCQKKFTQNSHLIKHLNSSIHSDANTCDVCHKTFRRGDLFLKHMKEHREPIIISNEIILPGFNEIKL